MSPASRHPEVPTAAPPTAREAVRQLPAYVPGARLGGERRAHPLASNENPFDPLDPVREAVARAAGRMNRYPDMFASQLVGALAAQHGVDPAGVVAGCGSVAVLGHVLQAYCDAGDEVVYAWRSFEAYPILVRLQGAVPVPVPLDGEGRHDLPAMAAAVSGRTRVVLVCSPNNPTGPAVTDAEMRAFLAAIPSRVLVVLDEAYVEFVTAEGAADGSRLLLEHPNLLILRTFSKAYGLAGLRVGYAVAHPDVARPVRTASTPFGVNDLAQVGALASLEARDALLARVADLVAERERVVAALATQGWTVPDAQGNFVWLATGPRTADLAADAARHGVLVRPFAGEGIRASIGSPAADDALLALTGGWLSPAGG